LPFESIANPSGWFKGWVVAKPADAKTTKHSSVDAIPTKFEFVNFIVVLLHTYALFLKSAESKSSGSLLKAAFSWRSPHESEGRSIFSSWIGETGDLAGVVGRYPTMQPASGCFATK
jgi:hypothetical protein